MAFKQRADGKSIALWVGIFVILALALRIVFNVGPAFQDEEERYLYSGNDPWYHDRTVDHILETGESLTFDPAINFPEGGNNPNPPLYDWTTAVDAKIIESTGAADPVGLALNLAVAFWGALIVIPVFMIANDLWGRRAGLWSAFFMAISAPHIQRTVFGFADHDATAMFFIALSFAFLVKGVKALDGREHVPSWKDGAVQGIRGSWGANKVALLWGALSGVSLAATALTWKGYPYALAIMAVAFGLQLLVDHVRNKDSTAVATLYIVPVLVTLLVSLPYYLSLGFGASTVMPNLYVLLGMLAVGIILVPTRELPSIIVFPALLVAAGLGLLLMLFVFPDVGRTIFTGLGYFEQTKLYTTIAEAQRTELGLLAANFGFFTFLLAFWPFGRTFKEAFKGDAAKMFMLSWAIVAGFMAFAASRFIMNAAPVFVIFAGVGTAWILAKAGFEQVARRRRQAHGQNAFKANMGSLTWRSTGIAVAVALVLVLPNLWLGVDAATSADFDSENGLLDNDPETVDRFGAFGIGFDLYENGWLELFDHLATLDQDVSMEDRPAFMAWWDYGHWATNLGQHPTVADPFQNHFQHAGRFLASESEAEAQTWLAILLIEGDMKENGGRHSAAVSSVMQDYDVSAYGGDLDGKYAGLTAAVSEDEVFAFYGDLSEATGKHIGYMGVDSRMFPLSAQQSGIFYAPAFLANKNPDEFLKFTYSGTGLSLTLEQYGVDESGDSYRLEEPRFVTADGEEWSVIGGQAFPPGTDPFLSNGENAVPVQGSLTPTERFFESTYTRGIGSVSTQEAPGDGMAHWRAIHESTNPEGTFRTAALLAYYEGHTVSGRVLDTNGIPIEGIQVTFMDGFGAAHDEVQTDAAGNFEVLAPFGDDLKLVLRDASDVLYEEPWTVTKEDAAGGITTGVVIEAEPGSVAGIVFRDMDGNGVYNATSDELLSGASVSFDGQTTTSGGDGNFSLSGLQPKGDQLTVSLGGFSDASVRLVVPSGGSVTKDVALTPTPVTVNATFMDDGVGVTGIPISFAGPQTTEATTGPGGLASLMLQPGSYDVTVDHAFTDSEGNEVVYEASTTINVPLGADSYSFTLSTS